MTKVGPGWVEAMRSARPVQPEPVKGTRVKLHPSLAGRRYREAGSGVRACRGCLGGVWACLLSETVMEMAPGRAEMEAVDQSQIMPELGLRRGPK